MKDSGVEWIGKIPEEWNVCRIKDYFLVKNGSTPNSSKSNYWNGGIPWITPSDYKTNDVYINGSARTITKEGYDSCGTNMVPVNSIIVSNRAPIGSVGIAKVPLCTSQGCKSLVKRNDVESKFVYYFLTISNSELNILGRGTTFLELSSYDLGTFAISLPQINEQNKIVVFLDEKIGEIESVIAKTKETIEDYKKYKQAIITDAVTKGLNPDVEMKESKLQWVDTIPRHWKENKILHIINMPVIDGPHVSPELVDNGIPYISADAIENGKINFDRKRGFITKEYSEECNKRYKPKKNDILVVKLGASTGKMAIVGDETDFNIWVPLAVVRCKVDILPQYVFYSMESSYFKNEIRNGWTFGTQETLGVKTLEQLKVFVPSLEEQKQIAEYLDKKCTEIDKMIAKKEELLADMEDYKKSFIYEYVTGKKEVE